ncbi:hypothetical protein ND861_14340 [Leptospira sp. 2 VSF19]|uniref:AsmA family protein n=1 Tax=Leptospira soteropolitanensis TaxID=2950025 RepID=A0AAW5VJ44_9LEPT|nr:hypothetical protein [Leptospira soteropolitanensis]MCW7493974.1 hypothetical protein [Leptospira soteropolitanensis]MCW7501568.1 hypothetical protein [Leptospira soteropolitanensis]MCW7523670.1 hypothetical protein [Leptospira soteropolitanensis]MCW7527533.1 hypothetical protein [Leptospira soteropolitanensis]MCW7531387.1 hypothetical protein [Leptospira soteropolitanensis]
MNPILKVSLGVAKTKTFRGFLVLFLLYKSIFNVFTADLLVPKLFSHFTMGKMEGDFRCFSLFFGIEIDHFRLYPGLPFENTPLAEARRIRLRYNLPLLILGKIKITEIGLQDAKIYIEERLGKWNIASLVKPSVSLPEEPPLESKPPLTEIKTYLPLQASAYLNLDTVAFQLKRDTGSLHFFSVDDLSLQTELVTNRFTSIPFDLSLLNQIDHILLSLNTAKPIPLNLDSEELKWKQTIPLSLRFEWDRTVSPEMFLFTTDIGKDDLLLEVRGKPVPFGLRLLSDIHYDNQLDQVGINQFDLKVLGQSWVSLSGSVKEVSNETPKVDIVVGKSNVQLTSIQKSIDQLKGIVPEMKLSGELSLEGTGIRGDWKNAFANLKLRTSQLNLKIGKAKSHSLPSVFLDISSQMNFADTRPLSAAKPFPYIKSLKISPSHIDYNGAFLSLSGEYSESAGLDFKVGVDKLQLGEYASGLGGKLQMDLGVTGESFVSLLVHDKAKIEGFRYQLDRSRSPSSYLGLDLNATLVFDRPFGLSEVKISDLKLEQKTITGNKALELDIKGNIHTGPNLVASIQPLGLHVYTPNLLLILPLVLKEKVSPIQNLLGNHPILKLSARYSASGSTKKINADLRAELPGLEIKDLKLTTDLSLVGADTNEIIINTFRMNAFGGIFNLAVNGKLNKTSKPKPPLGPYFGNLDLNFGLMSQSQQYLAKGLSFQGDLGLNLSIRDYDINGEFHSKVPLLSYTNQKCPGENCKAYVLEDVAAKIPIQHNLARSNEDSLIVGDKSIFIKNYGRSNTPNLTIRQVLGTHPNIPNLPFEYVKRQKDGPGLSAFIEYKENYANIESLRSYSLDGLVLGKNIIFNLGNLDPKSMEFRGNFLIRDIDLKQLMAPKVRDKIDDGKLKADLNISLRDLSEPVANLDLFFSIFQIGRDFGKSALNVISPQNFLIDRITDSYSINKIDVSLSKGLVYADVYFNRSLLSLLINLEDGKISQQRMPLANFLKRAQSEIQTYQE